MGTEVAVAIERGIASQSALLTTLSLAVIGGLFALLLQIRIHNASHSETQQIAFRQFWAFWVSIVLAGLAIGCGYLISGIFVQFGPTFFAHEFDPQLTFSSQMFAKSQISMLRVFALAQFVVFSLAIVFGGVFVFSNRK